jgi:hypothetical protein
LNHPAERVRRRRSRQRRHPIRRAAGVLVLLLLIGFGAWSAVRRYYSIYSSSIALNRRQISANSGLISLARQAAPPAGFGRSQREVYPYSVIPGGVRTPQELRDASDRDGVVGTHYAGFNFDKARVIQVKQAKLVYVSYRIGGKIFWTRKRLTLHVGEKLITDGRTTARTRCGNQVSAARHMITSPVEPSIETLDQVIAEPVAPAVPFESALLQPPGFGATALPPPGGGFPPGSIGPPPIGGGGCTPSCFIPPPPGPPPVNMAEPDAPSLLGSFFLFWLGIAGVYFHRWRMQSKRANSTLRLR